MLSAAKRILDSKHPAMKKLTKVKSDVVERWKNTTLPYVEDGVRLLPRAEIANFDDFMNERHRELEHAAEELQAACHEIKNTARAKLKDLYNPNDYPPEIASKFKVDWEYLPLDPPNYLAQTNPEL